MTMELLAFFPLDGSAIIKREASLFFVAPPYEKRDIQPVDKRALDRAILRFGFRAAEKRFESWGSLLEFLDSEVREARQKQGQDISEVELGREIIDSAPPDVLSRFLDKVEYELFPSLQFEHAEAVILAILDCANATRTEAICRRAVTLFRCLKKKRNAYLVERSKLLHDDSLFKNLQGSAEMAKAQVLADAILERKSIWAFA